MPKKSGFTLLELSIVLVIIGLLAGGILVGRDMIENAKTRKLMTSMEKVLTATNTFRIKYNALPGDMGNAADFFDPECMTILDAAAGILHSCNGDGNGVIYSTGGGFVTETRAFFVHLNLAKLTAMTFEHEGCNADELAMAYSGYNDSTYTVAHSSYFTDNGINVGLPLPVENMVYLAWQKCNTTNGGASLSPIVAYTVDEKMDDGRATTGKVRIASANTYYSGNCTVAGNYVMSNNGKACKMFFSLGAN